MIYFTFTDATIVQEEEIRAARIHSLAALLCQHVGPVPKLVNAPKQSPCRLSQVPPQSRQTAMY